MREKILNSLRWISQNWLAILMLSVAAMLVLIIVVRSILPRPPIELTSTSPATNQRLAPTGPITLTFDIDPILYGCRVTSTDTSIVSSQAGETNIRVEPKDYWVPGSRVELQITCERYQKTLNWLVLADEELTPEQAIGVQSQRDVIFSETLQQFYKDNPFADSFPLKRKDYTLYYHDDINKIVIGTNRVFSDSEKQQILQTERREMTALGVPAEIEVVFATDLP